MVVYVYSLENCPRCEELKGYIDSLRIGFLTRDMSTAESIAELRCNQVFAVEAPVLQINDNVFVESNAMFDKNGLRKDLVKMILEAM